jgi:DNA-binding transcriptional ArsR family regulator
MRRDVFQAIADPTRREIIHVIAGKSLTLNAVADSFDVSRQAISKHIKILTECGLITINVKGRERYCEVKLDQLSEVSVWVEQYRKFYEDKLDSLEMYLTKLQSKNKKNGKQKRKK